MAGVDPIAAAVAELSEHQIVASWRSSAERVNAAVENMGTQLPMVTSVVPVFPEAETSC